MQHVVRYGSVTVSAAVHRYTEHVNERLLTAACVLQVLLFLQEEEEESSPETQMKTNKGTCGSPLHICSFCFFLSPLSSSSPLLTGVSWYTGFYWSGLSSEESVCCLYQQRSPCVFMAKDWSETRAAQTAAGKRGRKNTADGLKTSWRLDSAAFLADWLLLTFPPFPLLSGSEERRVCLWGYERGLQIQACNESHVHTQHKHTHCTLFWSSLQIDFMDKEMQLAHSHSSFYSLGSKEEHCEWTGLFPEMDQARWIPESLSEEKPHDHQNQKFKRSLCKIDALFPVLICN